MSISQNTSLERLIVTARRAVDFHKAIESDPASASGTGARKDLADWNAEIVRSLAELTVDEVKTPDSVPIS